MNFSTRTVVLALMMVLFAICALAAEPDLNPPVEIDEWLVLGPLPATAPVFVEAMDDGVLDELLASAATPDSLSLPVEGLGFEAFGKSTEWRENSGSTGSIEFDSPSRLNDRQTAVVWLKASLRTSRFVSATLEVECEHLWKVLLDGTVVDGDLEVDLEPGDHIISLATIFDPKAEAPWTVSVAVAADPPGSVSTDLRRERELGILDVLDSATVTAFDLSPTGDRVVLSLSRIKSGSDDRESWVELRDTEDGSLLRSWRGAPEMAEAQFAPTGNRLSYVTRNAEEDTSTLWITDLEGGESSEVVGGIEHWESYLWSPTGKSIVFGTTTKAEKNESGVKRLRGLLDRMAGHRDVTQLHVVTVENGARQQLTGGPVSASAAAFSPDGSRLLVTREIEDFSRRPYSRNELWELDLESGDARKLRDFRWLGGVEYSPDGRRLLVQAGPSEFGEIGITVEGKGPVNDFDGQLFIWDPESDAVDPISRSFDPSVTAARWSPHDGAITLRALDGHRVSLFRFEPELQVFTTIRTGIESVGSFDVALRGSTIVAEGTSVWEPQRVVVAGRADTPERILIRPSAERFAAIRRGEVREWNFTASDGREVAGRVYFPTSFESGDEYPAIVNYYGGTSPMNRSFGGRYPAEWWAANGYVVYILTPTGAYGWGQEDSTVHVNDWGEVTSRQIIEATEAFLEAHPFVDAERVGCIGASYGGFMTMKLVTETDIFAAAVAHAGISALSSYWGEGYWGYSYGAVANADSFPWNRRDIFVDRSPLFSADKVTTPLLLTHGDEDPNVPMGESDQFYAALKLLGAEVEYLRVSGLGHLIMEHDKRALWSKSIIAWFDLWLKEQPEFWEGLYPGN